MKNFKMTKVKLGTSNKEQTDRETLINEIKREESMSRPALALNSGKVCRI